MSTSGVPDLSDYTSTGHYFRHNVVHGGNVHFGDVHVHERNPRSRSSTPELKPAYILPRSSTPSFTGRSLQLKQLHSYLAQLDSETHVNRRLAVILGLGGCGKTQFCLKYWGVFWIDAGSRSTAERGYADIGRLFGKGPTFAAGKYWLSQIKQPYLLILDNDDRHEVDLLSLLPLGQNGHILITTRNVAVSAEVTARTIRLSGMDPEEALELLIKLAYPSDTSVNHELQQVARTVAERLGYLAIALQQAGATVRCKIYTMEKFLNHFLGRRGQIRGSYKNITFDELDIVATWEIPFHRIELRQTNVCKDAVAILNMFAFLHNNNISELIFQAAWHERSRTSGDKVSIPSILHVGSTDADEYHARVRSAILMLHDYAILDFDTETGTCSIHPVVHAWARSRITDYQSTEYWLNAALFTISRCRHVGAPLLPDGFLRSLLPHIEAVCRSCTEVDGSFMSTIERSSYRADLANICSQAGQWRMAIPLIRSSLDYFVSACGQASEETLQAKRELAECHWDLFEVGEAIRLQDEVRRSRWWHRPSLTDWARLFHPEYVEYLLILSDLTRTLWLAGQHNLSKRAGERAVAGLAAQLGLQHGSTVEAMFNLGRTYMHLGKLAEAHALLVQVLRGRKNQLGFEHLQTLMVREEIAMCLCHQGRHLHQAEIIVRKVLGSRKRILGEEHAYTLWSVNDLSKVLCARDKPSEAASLLESTIDAVARTLGDDHVGMHMHKGNLARAYSAMREWPKAQQYLEDILPSIDRRHTDWLRGMIAYARILIRQDKFAIAEQVCLNALVIAVDSSDSMKDASTIRGLLVHIYQRTDKQNQALMLLTQYPNTPTDVMEQNFGLF